MKILSIETSSETGSVALLREGRIECEILFGSGDIAARLVSAVEKALGEFPFDLSAIDLFVVSVGPGSWTGTRLGLSFAKGLARGDKNRIYAVTTAQGIFFGLREMKLNALCLVNAYGGKIFVSRFNGRFYHGSKYYPEKILREDLQKVCGKEDILLSGPALSLLPESVRRMRNVRIAGMNHSHPRAGINGLLALEKMARKIPSLPPDPYYGR